MRFRVQKLIRDRLPAIMRAQGLQVFDRRLNDAEFIAALKDKLLEEAQEVGAATSLADLIDELADVMEVIAALADASGVPLQAVEERRQAKRTERGGFAERVFNAAVEARDGLPAAEYYLARPMQYPRED